jgi:hypothetical protein
MLNPQLADLIIRETERIPLYPLVYFGLNRLHGMHSVVGTRFGPAARINESEAIHRTAFACERIQTVRRLKLVEDRR